MPAVSTAAVGKLYELGFLVKSGTALERLAEIDHVIFDKTGTLTLPGISLDADDLSAEEAGIALALAQHSSHPVSRAVVTALDGREPAQVSQIEEIAGDGIEGLWNGHTVRLGRAEWAGGEAGLTLRIGARVIPLGQNETLRPGAKTAIEGLRASGLSLSILSGDAMGPARQIAAQLGIDDVTAAVAPQEKHARAAGRDGHLSAMVGDGLNDTAALAAAHASIAPSSALDASRNAADVVVLRDGLDDLPRLFAIARMASHLARQNFAIAVLYNLIAIPVALAGLATPLLAALAMSVSSLTVLLNALRVRIST